MDAGNRIAYPTHELCSLCESGVIKEGWCGNCGAASVTTCKVCRTGLIVAGRCDDATCPTRVRFDVRCLALVLLVVLTLCACTSGAACGAVCR